VLFFWPFLLFFGLFSVAPSPPLEEANSAIFLVFFANFQSFFPLLPSLGKFSEVCQITIISYSPVINLL